MANLGVLCLPMPSHMTMFLALARALADRGHQVTFFAISNNEKAIREAGFGFELLEPDSVPVGTLGEMMRQMSTLGNIASMKLQGRFDDLRYEAILTKAPKMIKNARTDAMIIDQAEACSGTIAEAAGLPWVSVCCGLLQNSEPGVPPFFTSWQYNESRWGIARNQLGYLGIKLASSSTARMINRYRTGWGLAPFKRFDDTFSPFAQISQQIREFDFPRKALPSCFHYVGPIRGQQRRAVDFPWDQLDGRPLVYASLGTVVNSQGRLYRTIAEGCAGLDAQLVLSLGGAEMRGGLDNLPGSPLVVSYAPQVELIRRAALTITHAGLNSTLESLAEGVPLVAIPVTFEQPGIAARIRWTGAGEFIRAGALTANRLRSAVTKVLGNSAYRQAAERMKIAIAQSRGGRQAAAIIEEVIRTKCAVTSTPSLEDRPSLSVSNAE